MYFLQFLIREISVMHLSLLSTMVIGDAPEQFKSINRKHIIRSQES